ncbi:MAG: hypothetical protein P8J50_05600 [Acidimicrobiales bacterium]|nr:hypothetical protein [Acidimicrobiales bacterium]
MTRGTSRRGFLRGVVGSGALGAGLAASGVPAAASEGRAVAEPSGTLVVIHLTGGLDGLSVLVPYNDPSYTARRPSIAVASPGERYGAIDLGRGVGLHPALAPLWNTVGHDDRLAIICGVGVHGDQTAMDDDEVWPVTVDVRRVLADAVSSHGFRPWWGGIFPDLPMPNRSLGLLLSR